MNGVNVVGKTQEDIVNQLRAINIGSTVNILVSRQPDNVRRKLVSATILFLVQDNQIKIEM